MIPKNNQQLRRDKTYWEIRNAKSLRDVKKYLKKNTNFNMGGTRKQQAERIKELSERFKKRNNI